MPTSELSPGDATTSLSIHQERPLTRSEFQGLAEVPPELEWFANIDNPNTLKAYKRDVADFSQFVGITQPEDFRAVTRAHLIAWRKTLESRKLSASTIRRKLAAMSALYNFLCEANAVPLNPVSGVKRPKEGSNEGKTPALGDAEARRLLSAPKPDTRKGKRDRAIISTFLYHGLRLEELCKLRIKDLISIRGVMHLRVHGKGSKIRNVVAHAGTLELIDSYLEECSHENTPEAPLFQPVKLKESAETGKPLHPSTVYKAIVKYGNEVGITQTEFCVHSLRSTGATKALENGADIAEVQKWMGHANISTTRGYDYRDSKAEDSPTLRVSY